MLYLGPIIFGFLLGFVVGIRFRTNSENVKFTFGSYVVIVIVAIIAAWQSGPYPFYSDLPIATGFLSGAIGMVVGKLLFGK